jgi:EpsI family protein
MKISRIVLTLTLLLIFAVAGQVIGEFHSTPAVERMDFERFLPPVLEGWRVRDLPLAQTPELQRHTEKVLRFDQALYRIYERGDDEIEVYIAYWAPGKTSREAVQEHTPDICWTENGWSMTVLPPLAPKVFPGSSSVPMSNHRRFTRGPIELEVLYWHVEGQRFLQDRVSKPIVSLPLLLLRRLHNIQVAMTGRSPRQLFVRVSSRRRLSNATEALPLEGICRFLANSVALD